MIPSNAEFIIEGVVQSTNQNEGPFGTILDTIQWNQNFLI